MLSDTMRNYITILESMNTNDLHVASPHDVLSHISAMEAVDPSQAVKSQQTATKIDQNTIMDSIAKVTNVIDYLLTNPQAYQKKLVVITNQGIDAMGHQTFGEGSGVVEFRIGWKIKKVKIDDGTTQGITITFFGQNSQVIPTTITNTFEIINSLYKNAGWKTLHLPPPSRGLDGVETTLEGIKLRTMID
jgi:hypothetical protein